MYEPQEGLSKRLEETTFHIHHIRFIHSIRVTWFGQLVNSMSEWQGRHSGKDALRERLWALLDANRVSIGRAHGHIPNFVGAEEAATQLTRLPAWQTARVVKCNPDAAQAPVRLHALQEGKTVYMAVPRLLDERCFVRLHRDALAIPLDDAAETKTALAHGMLIAFGEMLPIDIVVVGCVAVSRNGGRTGKGAGFADIELGLLRHFGLVNAATPIVTSVHPLQIVADDDLPMASHDSPLNWIATPHEIIDTHTPYPQPTGIVWDAVQPDQFAKIPILRMLRGEM